MFPLVTFGAIARSLIHGINIPSRYCTLHCALRRAGDDAIDAALTLIDIDSLDQAAGDGLDTCRACARHPWGHGYSWWRSRPSDLIGHESEF
jgi:hypothetical protein